MICPASWVRRMRVALLRRYSEAERDRQDTQLRIAMLTPKPEVVIDHGQLPEPSHSSRDSAIVDRDAVRTLCGGGCGLLESHRLRMVSTSQLSAQCRRQPELPRPTSSLDSKSAKLGWPCSDRKSWPIAMRCARAG